jgi:hypothetical protein
VPKFVTSERIGPEWLTGGVWGAEASVLAVLVCFGVTALLLVVAYRRGTFVKRARAPRPMMEATPATTGNA